MNESATPWVYPVRLEGELDPPLSRWLWLVKWVLAIPHFFVLFFMWIAFLVLWIVALFAILFTGRYPRGIFDFNVGVMRWTWRVSFYTYSALGTDRYPPFSFDGEYPADLDIEYPTSLSRGKVLIKWWLLALPQYLFAAVFVGAGSGIGLVGIVFFIGAAALLFTAPSPRSLFALALGATRWCSRVPAYAALMTDESPPFRLDQ